MSRMHSSGYCLVLPNFAYIGKSRTPFMAHGSMCPLNVWHNAADNSSPANPEGDNGQLVCSSCCHRRVTSNVVHVICVVMVNAVIHILAETTALFMLPMMDPAHGSLSMMNACTCVGAHTGALIQRLQVGVICTSGLLSHPVCRCMWMWVVATQQATTM